MKAKAELSKMIVLHHSTPEVSDRLIDVAEVEGDVNVDDDVEFEVDDDDSIELINPKIRGESPNGTPLSGDAEKVDLVQAGAHELGYLDERVANHAIA